MNYLNRTLKFRYCLKTTNAVIRTIKVPIKVADEPKEDNNTEKSTYKYADEPIRILYRGMPYEPVSVEKSIEYMNSPEYKSVYLDKPVWFYYRRNFKGHYMPIKPRKSCVVSNKVISRHACPICRDNHLILSYKHLVLLKQFLDPLSGEAFPPKVTGLCQKQFNNLLFNVEIAAQLGLIEKEVPFRLYDYSEYYSDLPTALDIIHISPNTSDKILPGAARIFSVVEEFTDITPPPVPNRYEFEEKEYLERRAKKMALLKAAKVNKS